MPDIFCKIIAGEIPSDKVAEGTDWIAINDIRPKAPVHVLIIPRAHAELETVGAELAGFLGIILSVPAAATIQEFIRDMQAGRLPRADEAISA